MTQAYCTFVLSSERETEKKNFFFDGLKISKKYLKLTNLLNMTKATTPAATEARATKPTEERTDANIIVVLLSLLLFAII